MYKVYVNGLLCVSSRLGQSCMSTLVTKIASEERYKPLEACPQESHTIYFSQKFLKQDLFSKVYNNYPNEEILDNFKGLNWTSVS